MVTFVLLPTGKTDTVFSRIFYQGLFVYYVLFDTGTYERYFSLSCYVSVLTQL